VPPPSLLDIDGNPRSSTKEKRQAVFVCPYCGLASLYSTGDVLPQMLVDKPSLFEAGECLLVSAEIECDGQNCEAPKVIHTIQGDEQGTWRPKAIPRDWQFSDSARCGAGHKLRLEAGQKYKLTQVPYPF
jgi:hypothetical protein